MPTKRLTAIVLGLLLVLFSSSITMAQDDSASMEDDSLSIYGYLMNYLNYTDENSGDEIYLRLKGEWRPTENLLFHLELANIYRISNLNPYAFFGSLGLSPIDQAEFPLDDFNREFRLDHYWGSATIGRFNLQFGQIPLAWGTAYVFNPTSKACLPPLLDTVAEETPGTPAIAASYAVNDRFSIQGYLAFQEKLAKKTSSMDDGDQNNFPFGIKLQATTGKFDWSVSWTREVLYLNDDYQRNYYLGADFVGAIGDVGIYGEAAVNFPRNAADTAFEFDGHDLEELTEISLGGDYYLDGLETTIRFELYHQGKGEDDKTSYNPMRLLSGELPVLAEDYLFLAAEKKFSDYYELRLAMMVNLNDDSCALFPEFSYSPYLDFTVSLGAVLFGGPGGSEFDGVFNIGGADRDLTNSAIYLKCKLSF